MSDGIRALLARHLPDVEVRSVVELGQGLDNVAFEVNGELVVRASKERDPVERAEATRREAELLAVVGRLSPVPVPEVVLLDADAGVLAYAKLPGVPLLTHPVAEPLRLAPALGELLGCLHRAPVAELEQLVERDAEPPAAWLDEAREHHREIAGALPGPARRRVEEFLGRTPPAGPDTLAFCHNDLGAEHVLVDVAAHAVTGVIDWSDAAVTDPAYDLALVHRDLGPDVLDAVLRHYGCPFGDAERERAVFYARCALLEDIAYGLETGARAYLDAGLAHLDQTFA